MTLVYLHGFASDGGGWKADTLAQFFPEAEIVSPDLSADPRQVVAGIQDIYQASTLPIYWFGTSLGGFYAYYASAIFGQKAFLFNPSLRPDQTLERGIGHWDSFRKGRDYHFREAYLQELAVLRTEAEKKVKQEQLHFFLAKDDEVLDLSGIPTLFPRAAQLTWYKDGGHSFGKFAKAIKQIKRAGWLP